MTGRRKILCLDTNLEVGGVVTVLVGFLGRLDKSRFDVTVACEAGGRPEPTLRGIDGLRVVRCRFGTKSGHSGASLWGRLVDALSLPITLWAILRLSLLVWRRGIDLVHTSDKYRSVLVATAVATLTRRPFLYHIHCNCVPNRLNRFALRRATTIVANSHAMKVDFIKALGPDMERIVVVHNGVDVQVPDEGPDMREQLGIPGDAVVIGAASRLCANKGQAELVTAFGSIAERAPGAYLLIAGDDSIEDGNRGFREELDALVRQHGVAERTIFLGFCTDMDAFYRTTDIVVDAAWEEAFGMVVVEPMIYGRPVVGTDAGGIPEIIDDGENGLLVPPRDPQALGVALLSLVVDAGWRAALGRRAREVVEQRFELGVHTEKVAALLDASGVAQ